MTQWQIKKAAWWLVNSNELINVEKVRYIRTRNVEKDIYVRFFFEEDDYITVSFDTSEKMLEYFRKVVGALNNA